MTTFSVRVSEAAAARFDVAASGLGGRSALLRRMIEAAGGRAPVATEVLPRIVRPARLMVRLTAADATLVADEAQAMGLPSTWVADLVGRHVRGRPRFSRRDEIALLAIQGEIRRIGVNVNQIARALNTAVLEGRVLDLELAYVEDLRRELRGHLGALREAFEGNLAYWRVEP